MPESPEEKETASEKHKNNPLITPEVTFHIKSVYQNIPFYWNPGKILHMRERLSPSAPARVKGPGCGCVRTCVYDERMVIPPYPLPRM